MPNLAIVGYGKMGRLIDQLAPEYGFTVTSRIDIDRNESLRRRRRGRRVLHALRRCRQHSKSWPRFASLRWSAPPAGRNISPK